MPTKLDELKEKLQDKIESLVLLRKFDHFTASGEGIENIVLFNKSNNIDMSYVLRGFSGIKFDKDGYCKATSGTLDHLNYHFSELTQVRI